MEFAQTLKRLMDREGLSNYQLAKELDCHQTSVKNWLCGSKPQKLMLKNIADYFGVSVDYLLGNDQKEKAPIDVVDEDLRDYLDELRNRPEMRMLFSTTKTATKAQIEAIVKMVEEMQGDK